LLAGAPYRAAPRKKDRALQTSSEGTGSTTRGERPPWGKRGGGGGAGDCCGSQQPQGATFAGRWRSGEKRARAPSTKGGAPGPDRATKPRRGQKKARNGRAFPRRPKKGPFFPPARATRFQGGVAGKTKNTVSSTWGRGPQATFFSPLSRTESGNKQPTTRPEGLTRTPIRTKEETTSGASGAGGGTGSDSKVGKKGKGLPHRAKRFQRPAAAYFWFLHQLGGPKADQQQSKILSKWGPPLWDGVFQKKRGRPPAGPKVRGKSAFASGRALPKKKTPGGGAGPPS